MHQTFQMMNNHLQQRFIKEAYPVHTGTWQGMDVSKQPAARMMELLNVTETLDLGGIESLDHWRADIQPFLPWADDHFAERVCGYPINPGNTWDKWRHGKAAARFLKPCTGPALPAHAWAYLAAMIDGEGTIYYRTQHRWQGVIRVYQKDPMICHHLHDQFKVGKVTSNGEKHSTPLPDGKSVDNHCHYWQINAALEVRWLLSNLLPYLIIKKDKGAAALHLINQSLQSRTEDAPLKKVWGQDWEPRFNHNYMTRLWPRGENGDRHMGLSFPYGDLRDLVELMHKDPLTRQACIPLFFPEDTGIGDGDRKPCTLGYQFIMRSSELHCYYPLRSCDFANHFADDVYLAVRLLLWILDELRTMDPDTWNKVHPGTLTIHATSLHMFINDYNKRVTP